MFLMNAIRAPEPFRLVRACWLQNAFRLRSILALILVARKASDQEALMKPYRKGER